MVDLLPVLFRQGKNLFVYPEYSESVTIKRYIFGNPPKELVEKYECMRTHATEQIKSKSEPEPRISSGSTPPPPLEISVPRRRSKAEKHAILAKICAIAQETGQPHTVVTASVNAGLPESDKISKYQVSRYRKKSQDQRAPE